MKNEDLKIMSFKEVAKNGIFALLFVGLLLFVIIDSREREFKYQETIKIMSEKISVDVNDIKEDVKEIKDNLRTVVVK